MFSCETLEHKVDTYLLALKLLTVDDKNIINTALRAYILLGVVLNKYAPNFRSSVSNMSTIITSFSFSLKIRSVRRAEILSSPYENFLILRYSKYVCLSSLELC